MNSFINGLSSIVWHLDSGASNHMTFARSEFISYENCFLFPSKWVKNQRKQLLEEDTLSFPLYAMVKDVPANL
eukprot:IDg22750t1